MQPERGSAKVIIAETIKISRMVILPSQSHEIVSMCPYVNWSVVVKGDVIVDYSPMV